ncbi:cytochrome bc complex cytochrome b subunit [bacterium]|nr:cytochrome bc complex cytochrome b subunit [bacterium]
MSESERTYKPPRGGFRRRFDELVPVDWSKLAEAGDEPIPHHIKKWWFCLGGTPLILFVIQILTGALLAFHYVPAADQAYDSVARITTEVRFGWFIRSLHKWSSNLMIVAVMFHMLRVYFTRAYRHPRQLNWIAGLGLLMLTLVFGFTGYSLVYEQLSYWGATVATNLANTVPLVGPVLADLLRGGPEIGPQTLTRLFALHAGLLPILTTLLIVFHVFFIRTHGVTEMEFKGEEVPEERRYFRFFPDHVMTEMIIALFVLYLLTVVSLIFPAHMGPRANPAVTPAHIKPEWYFYFQFRLLKLTSLQISVALTGLLGGLMLFWPFIDGWLEERTRHVDKIVTFVGAAFFLLFLAFTIWEATAA